jgi:hypothetical protein
MVDEANQPVDGVPSKRATLPAPKAVFGTVGAVGGAVLGGLAGPAGAIAGAVIGAAMGAFSSLAFETAAAKRDAHDEKLDRDLGIAEGDIGAPNLQHPPAKIGAFSAASSGAGSTSEGEPSEGPIGPAP